MQHAIKFKIAASSLCFSFRRLKSQNLKCNMNLEEDFQWLDHKRLSMLIRHMRISALRVVGDQMMTEDRGVYPFSELEQRNYQNYSAVQICRELILAVDALHESGVSLNGNIEMGTTFIRELRNGRFKVQFNLLEDTDWSLYEERYSSRDKAEDIASVGGLIMQLLKMPVNITSSKDKGERHWMQRLAEWMTYHVPHLRPESS